jgi:hypothetical protein
MLGIKNELEIWFFTSVSLLMTSATLGVAWLRARQRATRAEAYLEGMRDRSARPDNVVPALDAIAIEVERIGEGQRFLTRALADQVSRAEAAPRRGASITPH